MVELKPRPTDVGIIALDIYIPKRYVSQAELEKYDGVSTGKYTIGLAQENMAVCDDREDVISMSLTVVNNLLNKYDIDPKQIGRLEVGTESSVDKSKSVKTSLMEIFEKYGNNDIEGVDTFNACYGGTNALFNTLNWIESSSWDGRYGIVVTADIAVYPKGPARPTGGAAAVALLVGPNAGIVFDPLTRASYMSHAYDFYKPLKLSEYPEVDGKFSNICYISALDKTYNTHLDKLEKNRQVANASLDYYDYLLFHAPYGKLIAKGASRLPFYDYLRSTPDTPIQGKFPEEFEQFKDLTREQINTDPTFEKTLVALNKTSFQKKVEPFGFIPKNVGNSYTASVYTILTGLIYQLGLEEKSSHYISKRGFIFSYGSGLSSSLFGFEIKKDLSNIAKKLNVKDILESRTKISPEEFTSILSTREETVGKKDYIPKGEINSTNYFSGTYYLDKIDNAYRRSYKQFI